ncbi:MAG: hypothetical protein R3F39_10270 [Myxococcota bacterium]
MLRAITAISCSALAAYALFGCACTDVGCSDTITVTFSEPVVEFGAPVEGDGESPWFTVDMSFGDSTLSYVCVDGALKRVPESAAVEGWPPFASCSPWDFTLHGGSADTPKSMAISVHAARWSKSFDRLKATRSEVQYPNGKYCDGKCRQSSFKL